MSPYYNNNHNSHGGGGGGGGGRGGQQQSNNPLPVMQKAVKAAFEANNSNHDSWSLYFDKFSGYSRKNEPILNDVIKFYDRSESQSFLNKKLAQKYSFFAKLAEKENCKLLMLENRSRLLVDMGHSHVLENVGFSFERISGLPYVPGSALKGATSNWAIWEANGEKAFENIYNSKTKKSEVNIEVKRSILDNDLVDIFGGNEGDEVQGKINFYGIFPMTLPKLEIDIITPHGNRIIPNHFLTVAAGTIWYVPISYNRSASTDFNSDLLDKTELLIEACLTNYGIGAKTASGYGKFDVVNSEKVKKLDQDLKTASKPKAAHDRFYQEYFACDDKDLSAKISSLESIEDENEQRGLLLALFEKDFLYSQIKRGKRKNATKKEIVERVAVKLEVNLP